MTHRRCDTFQRAVCRRPSASVLNGLWMTQRGDPDPVLLLKEHEQYVAVLRDCEVEVTLLDSDEAFPDAVFVEDTALTLSGGAILLRPGTASRAGERDLMRSALHELDIPTTELPQNCRVDGGDVLLFDDVAFVGLSNRTDAASIEMLATELHRFGYNEVHAVPVPEAILHLKTGCSLLDPDTILLGPDLVDEPAFRGLRRIVTEDRAAANVIAVNGTIIVPAETPELQDMLEAEGYKTRSVPVSQIALIDGGLSCLSLRIPRDVAGTP